MEDGKELGRSGGEEGKMRKGEGGGKTGEKDEEGKCGKATREGRKRHKEVVRKD